MLFQHCFEALTFLSLSSMLNKFSLIVIYLGLIFVGFGIMIVFLLLGGLFGDHGDVADAVDSGDLSADAVDTSGLEGHVDGGGDVGALGALGGIALKFASPSFIGLVLIFIGAIGLVTISLGIPPKWTVPISLVLSLIFGLGVSKVLYSIFKSSPTVRSIRRFEGLTAEVTLDIGPGDEAGSISVVYGGEMFNFSAKSIDGKKIPKGAIVRIVKALPGAFIVKKET